MKLVHFAEIWYAHICMLKLSARLTMGRILRRTRFRMNALREIQLQLYYLDCSAEVTICLIGGL